MDAIDGIAEIEGASAERIGKSKALLDADAELIALLRVYHPEREK